MSNRDFAWESADFTDARAPRARWRVPADAPWLAGHFPDQPVLPAHVVIEASVALLREALQNAALEIERIGSAKFTQPVTPGTLCEIRAESGEGARWRFRWTLPEANDSVSADLGIETCG